MNNNDDYDTQQKKKEEFQQDLNVRNVKAVVDYMNVQRKHIYEVNEELNAWKETVRKYIQIVNDLQKEVEQLRSESQVARFNRGSTVK